MRIYVRDWHGRFAETPGGKRLVGLVSVKTNIYGKVSTANDPGFGNLSGRTVFQKSSLKGRGMGGPVAGPHDGRGGTSRPMTDEQKRLAHAHQDLIDNEAFERKQAAARSHDFENPKAEWNRVQMGDRVQVDGKWMTVSAVRRDMGNSGYIKVDGAGETQYLNYRDFTSGRVRNHEDTARGVGGKVLDGGGGSIKAINPQAPAPVVSAHVESGITVVRTRDHRVIDANGDEWEVHRYTSSNGGKYWSAEGNKINKNGEVGSTFSKSIKAPIPDNVKRAGSAAEAQGATRANPARLAEPSRLHYDNPIGRDGKPIPPKPGSGLGGRVPQTPTEQRRSEAVANAKPVVSKDTPGYGELARYNVKIGGEVRGSVVQKEERTSVMARSASGGMLNYSVGSTRRKRWYAQVGKSVTSAGRLPTSYATRAEAVAALARKIAGEDFDNRPYSFQ